MIKDLQLFLNALERVHKTHYIQHLKVEPMSKPAYKNLTLTVYKVNYTQSEILTSVSKTYMITNEDEKTDAYNKIAEDLIVKILKL